MALFLSRYQNKIDSKARVSVPGPFRASLATDNGLSMILFRSQSHECLEGVSMSFMADINDRLDSLALFSSDQDDLATAIFGEAVPLSIDGDGRAILPSEMLEYASIKDQVMFVGMGRKFQIWSPDLYEIRRREANKAVHEKGLTLPGREG